MIIVAIFWAMFALPLLLALVAGSVTLHRREEALVVSSLPELSPRVICGEATDPTFGWRRWGFGGGLTPAATTAPVVDGGSVSWGWDGITPVRVDWTAFSKAIRASTPSRGICSPKWESTAGATTPARPISMVRETMEMVSRSGRKPGKALATLASR